MAWLEVPLTAVYFAALAGLFVYGVNCYVMILTHRAGRRRFAPLRPLGAGDPHPPVTVQLPLYNEKYVAKRAIYAASRLRYPKDRLQIQVLDDSTDETVDIVARAVADLRRQGFQAEQVRRERREGYKAGALAEGLRAATGEFVAIFDADFVPPEDFLARTLPGFHDPRVAVVQTRWGHLNREYSALTGGQAIGIDGHFGVEQAARCWGGLFLNFNGTAGIWRAAAIADAGGWTHDTLTEDLDLSYRAQLRGWRALYLPDVVCPAELPAQIAAFKSQQRRWATGSIQTACKLIPAILRSNRSAWAKLQAALHLTHYLVHPLMLAVVLASVPLLLLERAFLSFATLMVSATLFALSTFGPSNLYVYAERQFGPGWPRRLRYLPALMLLGTGIALSNTRAVVKALTGRSFEFVRTPKFGLETAGVAWRDKAYRLRGAWEGLGELGLGLYALVGAWRFLAGARYVMLPFMVIYTLGFFWVGSLTLWQAMQAARPHPRLEDHRYGRRLAGSHPVAADRQSVHLLE